ncbi:MAG: ATP-binding cassette domain-containing protein [Spirochaetales bacterium]
MPMNSEPLNTDILFWVEQGDLFAPEAFGPGSWSLAFGPEPQIKNFSWTWRKGEVWAILGSNTSGKSCLAYALLGKSTIKTRGIEGGYYNRFLEQGKRKEFFSFAETEKVLEELKRFDDSEFTEGGMHPGITVEEFFQQNIQKAEKDLVKKATKWNLLWKELSLEPLKHRGLKYLSTGELRKVILFKILMGEPDLCIFEDILEGLDQETREELGRFFEQYVSLKPSLPPFSGADHGIQPVSSKPSLLFLCDREDQIVSVVTHVLTLDQGRVQSIKVKSEKKQLLEAGAIKANKGQYLSISKKHQKATTASVLGNVSLPEASLWEVQRTKKANEAEPVLRLRNIHVSYKDRIVFEGFNFELYPGEHCFIQGPNGCGKSTLVRLITGDHPQGWVNDIVVAGVQRGKGEELQEVRRQSSVVSHDLHRAFLALEELTCLEVVLSGFFGTVGLYEPVGEERLHEARWALALCGLQEYEQARFYTLPWGVQRLVLATRAFVRRPPLMILDEPATGIDEEHRRVLFRILETIAEEGSRTGAPTLILVSHDETERLSCTRVELRFFQEGFHADGQPQYGYVMQRVDITSEIVT